MGKKDDQNYVQLRGHVPRRLARQFKEFCLKEDINYSEGMEMILTAFFSIYNFKDNNNYSHQKPS
jgi:hypothetical protein